MIRVTFISTGLSIGGAEMMLLKLLTHIDRTKFAPAVISLTTMGEVGQAIQAIGIPVAALNMRAGAAGLIDFAVLICMLRSQHPQLVQTWMYHSDLAGGLAARLAGIKHVVWGVRNSDLSEQRTKTGTRRVASLCARVSRWLPRAIVSCSAQARTAHVRLGYAPDKWQVIPNGFDLGQFVPDPFARQSVRTELQLDADTPLVGLIARYDPQKHHAGLIEAAKIVHGALPNVHYVLAGSGIDHHNTPLMNMIERLGLQTHVHLLGRRGDVNRLMAALDVLASPSLGEAFPNVLGEAMACEVPCVVTDVGDCQDIVGTTGKVVQAGDIPALAASLVEVLTMPPSARAHMGQQARQRVQAHYDIQHVVQQYERLYAGIMESA